MIMRAIYSFLKIALACLWGVFIGSSAYTYRDYHTHPGLYELTSAPWYLSIQVSAVFTVIISLILLLVIHFIRKKLTDTNNRV